MKLTDQIRVKMWKIKPIPHNQVEHQRCPICKSPLKLYDGERERVGEEMSRNYDAILDASERKDVKKLLQYSKNPVIPARFVCTKEKCPFNEDG